MDMFGDFHTQFAYMKTIFRTYWTDIKHFGLGQICQRLRRKSIKKDCKVYFAGEELLLHIFQSYTLALASKVLEKKANLNSLRLGPEHVFEVSTEILRNSVRAQFNCRKHRKDQFLTNNKDIGLALIHDITLFF